MVSSAAPQSETPTVSFQRRHITMQPAFTVRLRAPQANWTPHKAPDNCCPPLWVFSACTLYQVLNAEAAMNEIRGGGVANEWFGGGASWSGGGGREGVSLPETSQEFQNNLCCGVTSCSNLPGFQGFCAPTGGRDATRLPRFKVSFPLTRHATPRLISVTSATEQQGFLTPPLFLFMLSVRLRAPSSPGTKINLNKLGLSRQANDEL